MTATCSGNAVPKIAAIAGATQAKPGGCVGASVRTYPAARPTTTTCHTSTTFSQRVTAGRMRAVSSVCKALRSNT
jgi:hypothetical protein